MEQQVSPTANLMSVKQASTLLGWPVSKVLRAINKNKLPAEKVGWNWVILRGDVDNLIKAEKNGQRRIRRQRRKALANKNGLDIQ